MMFLSKLSKFFIIFILLFSCSPTGPGGAGSKSSSSKKTSSASMTQNTDSGTSAADPSGVVPKFQTGDLGNNFNKNASQKLITKPAEDKDKVFILQRINAYRPIWLNLAKNLSDTSGFWKWIYGISDSVESSGIGFVEEWSRESFERPKVTTDKTSIYQAIPTFAGSDDMAKSAERGDDFKIIGHTLSQTLNFPNYLTGVLSLYAISPQDPLSAAISPPMGYKKIYYKLGPLTEDLLQACMNVQKASEKHRMPDAGDMQKCDMARQGSDSIFDYLNVQMGGNTMTGVGDLSNYFQMQTLVIWQAIPRSGYQCLGQVVTNTTDQPATSSDPGGIYAQNQQTFGVDENGNYVEMSKADYPIYCVQQKFLVEGKLQPITTNGSIDFYRVTAKDDTGYPNANLFWAVPSNTSEADRKNIKVYVLNKKYLKVLPDLKIGK